MIQTITAESTCQLWFDQLYFHVYTILPGADPEGGAEGARPSLFAPNSLKSPLNWPKKSWERAPEATAPPSFSNPGSAPVFCSRLI